MRIEELSKILHLKSSIVEDLTPSYVEIGELYGTVSFESGKFYLRGDTASWPHEACHVKLYEMGYPEIWHKPIMVFDTQSKAFRLAAYEGYNALMHPLIWQLYRRYLPGELAKEFERVSDIMDLDVLLWGARQKFLSREIVEMSRKLFAVRLLTYEVAGEGNIKRFEDCRRLLEVECKEIDDIGGRVSPVIARYVNRDAKELLDGFEKDIKYLWSEIGADIKIVRKRHERTVNGNEIEIWDLDF